MTRATPTPWRFFAIVQRPPASIGMVAAAVAAYGAYLAFTYPQGFDDVLGIALFLQVFAASTGYRDRLRRGHFDPILVARPKRASVAGAHWAVSIGPGLATWLALAAINLAARPHQWPTALTSAWLVAFFYVSTMAWAMTLPFPRLAGGALWLAVLVGLAGSGRLSKLAEVFKEGGGGWAVAVRQATASLVCPFLVTGAGMPPGTRALVIISGATAAVWGFGLAMVKRLDGTLADPG